MSFAIFTGLEHAHNRRFKRNLSCLLSLAGVDEVLASNQKRQMVNSVKQQPKYNLIAVCFDGSEIEIGEFHKKSKKYTGYVPGTNPWKVGKKAIHEFKFIANN